MPLRTLVLASISTGRSLRACIEELEPQDYPQHVLVSLLGNIMSIASRADATFVSIGEMSEKCPMHIDCFIKHDEVRTKGVHTVFEHRC
ncbi:MAG: DNA-binding transcriptional regulator LsrR (DeoR family) [Candidatus Azotimanducaceae bacterium]|jgi:DNA-binding transcriptional regulator LsrR (DeoR family)